MTNVAEVIQRACSELATVARHPVENVASCVQEGEGWRVTLETIERKAVPDSSDLLGTYAVLVDAEGNLRSFQRMRVRRRGESFDEKVA